MDIIHTLTSVIRLWQDENLAWSHVAPAFISGKGPTQAQLYPSADPYGIVGELNLSSVWETGAVESLLRQISAPLTFT